MKAIVSHPSRGGLLFFVRTHGGAAMRLAVGYPLKPLPRPLQFSPPRQKNALPGDRNMHAESEENDSSSPPNLNSVPPAPQFSNDPIRTYCKSHIAGFRICPVTSD
jgi:hypothetical protein